MPRVRPNGAQRWANRTAAATPDYQAGVASPRTSWQQATVAASDAHKQATTIALNEGRFAKGVMKAGDQKWQRNASGKGAERFGPGAAAGVSDYEQGVAPYIAVIEGTQLPPRGPKGDPRNFKRVEVMAMALRKKKTGSISCAMALAIALAAIVVMIAVGFTHRSKGVVPSGGDKTGLLVMAEKAKAGTSSLWASLGGAGGVIILCLGAALDTITFSATAPGAAGAAAAAAAGDSAFVRNTPFQPGPMMLQAWVKSQVSGFVQILHPSGHDQVRDIRARHVATAALPLLAEGYAEPLEPQEAFTVTIGGSAVAGQTEILETMVYYPDLPGIQARLIDLNELDARFVEYVTIEDTTTATVAAQRSGARALNAGSDLLIANTDYAIVGAHIGALCAALTIRGTDTGNLPVGIPGMNGRPDLTCDWFTWLAQEFNLPLIPVINSANKGAIFIENVQDQALTAVPFSLLMIRLSMG